MPAGTRRRRHLWRRLLIAVVIVVVVLAAFVGGVYAWAALSTSSSFVARAIVWGDSDVGDLERFPARAVHAAAPAFSFAVPPGGANELPFTTVIVEEAGTLVERDLEEFLESTGTTAFLVIQGDTLLYERYFNGYERDSIVYSFSVAKSFVSALVGIAIEQGLIASVDDPVTDYVPELAERDPELERITIRHLLSMSSGLRFREQFGPWGDEAATYYDPNLRRLALEETEVVEPPGQTFVYNDYNPLLLGLVLERTTGMSVSAYLEEKLWKPLGMEADGSWSLDSEEHGFEKMNSGVNGRPIDVVKLGVLYRDGGAWEGEQLVPRSWVEESTAREASGDPSLDYQYGWWTPVGEAGPAFTALGHLGQYVYVVPSRDVVIARFGTEPGYPEWPQWPDLLGRIAARL